jgi:hypothetical protein
MPSGDREHHHADLDDLFADIMNFDYNDFFPQEIYKNNKI